MIVRNDQLSALLVQAVGEEPVAHRRLALERAAKDAWRWSEEAAAVLAAGRELTELRSVGPWVAGLLEGWIASPPASVPPLDATRTGFLTYAQVCAALDADPSWETTPHGDLQMHTTDSDGSLDLDAMLDAARASGLTFASITDHSESLRVANGMDAQRLREQGRRIAARSDGFPVLRSIEMDVFADGSGDMDPVALAELDVVLGAFHSELRKKEDVTERYLAAIRNPDVDVLAHPTTRMFDRRLGLVAEWSRVFSEAARLGTAIEIDGSPRRQDLPVELARIAVAEGVPWFTLGSDAHAAEELGNLRIAMAVAARAGIGRERILNYRSADEVRAWAADRRFARHSP